MPACNERQKYPADKKKFDEQFDNIFNKGEPSMTDKLQEIKSNYCSCEQGRSCSSCDALDELNEWWWEKKHKAYFKLHLGIRDKNLEAKDREIAELKAIENLAKHSIMKGIDREDKKDREIQELKEQLERYRSGYERETV